MRLLSVAIILAYAVQGVGPVWPSTPPDASWQVETVDRSGVGKFSSLRIDRYGNAHLAYISEDGSYSLKYGFWDHALKRWFMMTISRNASYCSLTLDSKQRPHISWADFGVVNGSKLQYAYWDGKLWNKQAIPLDAETVGYYTSLVLDAENHPSISFYEYNGPPGTDFRVRMRNVTWNGTYWEARTVDGDNQSGKFNDMAIDADGQIHLVYANVNALTAGVRYARWNGQSWHVETIDGRDQNHGELVGYSLCIGIDGNRPHVAYMNYSRPSLKYSVLNDGHWETEVVDDLAGVGYPDRNSLVIDKSGNPYISYYDAGRGLLKLAHKERGKWTIEIVDSSRAGFTSSMAMDSRTLWISYADEAGGGLKVARRALTEHAAVTAAVPVKTP